MYNTSKIKIFYNPKQVANNEVGYSKSPNKPKLLLEFMGKRNLSKHFSVYSDFKPFTKKDFGIAHNKEYIDNFFAGTGNCSSNGLQWNPQFADSVRYTNASLYHAIRNSIQNPKQICFSPTSGFHHARPSGGSGFCTFSGQVIASVKLYNEYGVKGAYIDLDGHYGNSIEDSRQFVRCKDGSTLDDILPIECNVNPRGTEEEYIKNLKNSLDILSNKIMKQEISYIVACSGADSLVDDDLGGQVSLKKWLQAKRMIYSMILKCSQKLKRPVPLTISLFGGYRGDDYNSVLDAHTLDLLTCMGILQNKIDVLKNYKSCYKPKKNNYSFYL